MYDLIKNVAGSTDVTENKNGTTTISGVSAKRLAADIQKIWNTSRIAGSMFLTFTRYRIVIPTFYCYELAYIVKTIGLQSTAKTPRRELFSLHEALQSNTWLRKTHIDVKPWMNRDAIKKEIKFTLKPHQNEFIDFYERVKIQYSLNGMLLSSPAGTGKTTMCISVAVGVGATKVIVVSPKNAIYRVWEDTLNNDMITPQQPFVYDRDKVLQPEKKWHIFHYESIEHALALAKHWEGKGEKVCILLDESHSFNDIKSMRTARFIELCTATNATDIIWSSGTPIKALGYEAIPLIKSIDPLFTDKAEETFKKMYGRDAKRALDILAARMGIFSYTPPKQEIVQGEPITEMVKVQMPNSDKYTLEHLSNIMRDFVKERTAYYDKLRPEIINYYRGVMKEYEKGLKPDQIPEYRKYQEAVRTLMKITFDARFHGELAIFTNRYEKEKIIPNIPEYERKKFKDIKSIVKYPLLKVRGEALGRILTKERVQCHIDMLAHIDFKGIIDESLKKTIVFTSYVRVVDEAASILAKQGYKPTLVYGDTNSNLPSIVANFAKKPEINPLIATMQSLSTAVPLIMANTIILLNQPWRSFEREQAIARIHRLGQDTQTFVFEILLDTGNKQNISTRSLDIMEWSRQQVEMITGIKGDVSLGTEAYGYPAVEVGDPNFMIEDVKVGGEGLTSIVPPESTEPEDFSFEKLFDKDGNRLD